MRDIIDIKDIHNVHDTYDKFIDETYDLYEEFTITPQISI